MFRTKKLWLVAIAGLVFLSDYKFTRAQDDVIMLINYSVLSDQAVVDREGIKSPKYLVSIAKNSSFLNLSHQQIVEIQLAIQELGRMQGTTFYSIAFPEVGKATAADIMDRIAELGLSPIEIASRKAIAETVFVKSGREFVKLERERIDSILLPYQKKLASDLIVSNVFRDFTWDELFASAKEFDGLELTPEEQKQFSDAAKKIQESMKAEIIKIQREGWNKLMNEFPKAQREKLEGFLLIDSPK